MAKSNVVNLANKNSWKPRTQIEDLDEEVEFLAAQLQKSRLSDEEVAARIGAARASKMAVETVRKFRELETRQPRNFTKIWIAWVLGWWRKGWERIAS